MAKKGYVGEILAIGALLVGFYAMQRYTVPAPERQQPGVDCLGEGQSDWWGGKACCPGLEPVSEGLFKFPKCRPLGTLPPTGAPTPTPEPWPGCVSMLQDGNPNYDELLAWVVANKPTDAAVDDWANYWLGQQPDCYGLINDIAALAKAQLAVNVGETIPIVTPPQEPEPAAVGSEAYCLPKVQAESTAQLMCWLRKQNTSSISGGIYPGVIQDWRQYWKSKVPECTDWIMQMNTMAESYRPKFTSACTDAGEWVG